MNLHNVNQKSCCFIGHRKINSTEKLENRIYEEVEKLILNEGVIFFLFGSKSQFDVLCHKIVTRLKTKYDHIQRIYVRAEFPYINDE